tara:strand:- start:2266 stop:3186 length:921 start_codon:yes stop_codon:yes gene_type:complete
MGKQKKRKPTAKQTNRKRAIPLKRYNKIVSLIVKDNKRKKIDYNISDVRKTVSESIYPNLKNVAPSKIRLKQIKSLIVAEKEEKIKTVKIKAENVPREYFDVTLEWYELGEETRRNGEMNPILEMNERYPDIPIVIKTGDETLVLDEGLIGDYTNSKLQAFVERLRNKFENKSGFVFSGVPTWLDRKNKQYALWGTDDVAEDLPPENILDFEDVGEEPPIKKPKTKTEKDKPKDKPKPPKKEEPITTKDKGDNVAKISADFREREKELLELFKEGVYTKEEFKSERKDLKNQLNLALSKFLKGGKI